MAQEHLTALITNDIIILLFNFIYKADPGGMLSKTLETPM